MGKLRPFVRKDSYMPNKKWIPFVIGNGYTTTDGASGPAPEYETVTGNPVSFNAITPFPLRKLKVAFSPVQEGSGDPSPDNVRPILGWDSLNVEQRGKNLFDAEHPEKNGYYNVNGEYNSATGYSCYLVPAKAEQKYTCQGDFAGIKTFWDKDLNFISGINQGGGATKTFTTPAGTAYFRISIAKTSIDGTQQIEFGETASEVVPYVTGRSISISLGSTVYSGWVDVVTGVLTVDMAMQDMGNMVWGYAASYDGFFFSPTIADSVSGQTWECKCSQYKNLRMTASGIQANDGCIEINAENGRAVTGATGFKGVIVTDRRYTDADTFKTAMNGVQLVYELATPIPIQLTPQEVQSLAGDNTMWSDANQPITVEYRKN